MADFRALKVDSGKLKQLPDADSLVVGAGIKTTTGNLTIVPFTGIATITGSLAITSTAVVGGATIDNAAWNIQAKKDAANAIIAATSWDSVGAASAFGQLILGRGRGTNASSLKLASGDFLGRISFMGQHTDASPSAMASGATIDAQATSAWDGSSRGTTLAFNIIPNGSITGVERLRLPQDGGIQLTDAASAAVGTANTAKIRYNDSTTKLQVSLSGGAYVDLATGSAGGTLDQAYDSGGAGAGRTITVDSGSVDLTNNAANNTGCLYITKAPAGAQSGVAMRCDVGINCTGTAFLLTNDGSGIGMDIDSTNIASIGYRIRNSSGGTTLVNGLLVTNLTSATVGAQKASPDLRLSGSGWGTTGGAAQAVDWSIRNLPVQGTVATANLDLAYQIAAGGYTSIYQLTSGGAIDRATAATLDIGPVNATSINVGRTGQTVTFPGTVVATGEIGANGGLGRSTSGTLLLGTDTESTAVTISRSTITTTVAGNLAVTGTTNLNGNMTFGDASGDTVTVTGTATFTPLATFTGGLTGGTPTASTLVIGGGAVNNAAFKSQVKVDAASAYHAITSHDSTSTVSASSILYLARGRGTHASPALTASGDWIGRVAFAGAESGSAGAYFTGAAMDSYAAGAWSPTARPADIRFSTTPAATILFTERLRIPEDGGIQLYASDSAPVGAVNTARLRYNDAVQKLQVSLDSAAYVDVAVGPQTIMTGLTTSAMAVGELAYLTANNTVGKASSTSVAAARALGAYEGPAGSLVTDGICNAIKLISGLTSTDTPTAGMAVFLSATAGSLTTIPPLSGVFAEIGIIVDATSYAGSGTCKIALQIKQVAAL